MSAVTFVRVGGRALVGRPQLWAIIRDLSRHCRRAAKIAGCRLRAPTGNRRRGVGRARRRRYVCRGHCSSSAPLLRCVKTLLTPTPTSDDDMRDVTAAEAAVRHLATIISDRLTSVCM